MVTVTSFKPRQKEDGTIFYVLEVQGGIDLATSQTTGQVYLTAKKTSIPTTFNEEICSSLVGSKLQGSISKQECEPYAFFVKETGEQMVLSHRWVYNPEAVEELQMQSDSQENQFMGASASMSRPMELAFAS